MLATAPSDQGGLTAGGEWVNWSGSLRFRPGRVEHPADTAELARAVRRAQQDGAQVRVVGAGHSSSPLVQTREVLVSLDRLRGVVEHDPATHQATLRGGARIHEANEALLRLGLMMPNWGDVDYQTVAGAVATGTHGSGRALTNLATMLVGGRLVDGTGAEVPFSLDEDPELVLGLRCGLGATGVLTELRLQLEPAYRLRRQEWCTTLDVALAQVEELADRCRYVDFYWYPRSDEVKLRVADRADETLPTLQGARLVRDEEDWGSRVLPQRRVLRFDETEWAVPAAEGRGCFQEVRERVLQVHRRDVAWRVLYRFVAPDQAYLSEAHGRPTVTLSCHHNAGLPFERYFADLEPIFRRHHGRPHWGKKHRLRAGQLRPLYPRWDDFLRLRGRLDPEGVFLSPYLRGLLGVPA